MKENLFATIKSFGHLTKEEAAAFLKITREVQIAKHDCLLRPGQQAEHIHFVVQGGFRSYFIKDGEEITDYFFFEQTFATDYVSLFGDKPTEFYLEAIEDSQTLAYKRRAFLQLAKEYPVFGDFGRIHAERAFVEIEERMRILQHQSLQEKYEYTIEKFPQLFQRAPQHQIASYLGVKPESLSRIKRGKKSGKSTS
ncbi:MAG: Crp/Fnr family transcriptional regulator [Bacteroidota bacterium]